MAQPGNFTPILLYGSSTPGNVPVAASLTNSTTGSEIAINVADKNLFFKDSGGTVNTVPIRQSSTSSNGWLSSTDWNTFNNKSNTNGTVTSVAALTLGTTGTDLSSTVANGTTTPVITLNVPTASATNRGALSAADWTTFNNKTSNTGTVTSVAASVPAFLSISGSPITTSGTLAISYSGTALPVANGGTGQTTLASSSLLYGAGTSGVATSSTIVTDGTNLAIGPTSPVGANRLLEIGTSSRASTYVRMQCQTAGFVMSEYVSAGFDTLFVGLNNSGSAFNGIPSGAGGMLTAGAIPLVFATNATERGRFDASGNWLVGTTTAPTGAANGASLTSSGILQTSRAATGAVAHAQFYNPNGLVGSIQTSGTTTSYVTSSDYRLKENIAPMTGALATVSKLKPVIYNWKADGSSGQGFIAHELQAVAPDCVIGEKDAVDEKGKPKYQGVDTSFLVATLTAAIQEQQEIIESLLKRISALEA